MKCLCGGSCAARGGRRPPRVCAASTGAKNRAMVQAYKSCRGGKITGRDSIAHPGHVASPKKCAAPAPHGRGAGAVKLRCYRVRGPAAAAAENQPRPAVIKSAHTATRARQSPKKQARRADPRSRRSRGPRRQPGGRATAPRGGGPRCVHLSETAALVGFGVRYHAFQSHLRAAAAAPNAGARAARGAGCDGAEGVAPSNAVPRPPFPRRTLSRLKRGRTHTHSRLTYM